MVILAIRSGSAAFQTTLIKAAAIPMKQLAYTQPIWRQLLNDAPFAWFLRREASLSASYQLDELNEEDQKLAAFFDALRIGTESGREPEKELNFNDWGAVFIGTVLGLSLDRLSLIEAAIDAVDDDHDRAEELFQAVQWQRPTVEKIQILEAHDNPLVRQAVIAAYQQPPTDHLIAHWFKDQGSAVICRTLDFIGQHRLTQYQEQISMAYGHAEPSVQFAAAKAGVLTNEPAALSIIEQFALNSSEYLRESLEFIFRFGNHTHTYQWVNNILNSNLSPRIKVLSVAYNGQIDPMPLIFEVMEDVNFAQVAGEAFSLLTGANIIEDNLDEEQPAGDEPTAAQKHDFDEHYRDYEEELPWPSTERTQAWWSENASRFNSGERYLAGLAINRENTLKTLYQGNQAQRRAAAFELAAADQSQALIDTTIPVHYQLALLGKLK